MTGFNRADGAGFEFIADCVERLNANNPQVAARLLTSFRSWRMLEASRAQKAEASLKRIAKIDNISPDVADIVNRMLA